MNCFENTSQIKKITWLGLITNVFLSALKFVFGILGNSHAVVADAIHSLSDLTTDLAIIFGADFWAKPADEDHPYGHGRIETIVTFVIGVVLAWVGIGIAFKAVYMIQNKPSVQTGWIAFWGAVISIIFKEALFRKTLKVGKKIKSSAVIANAWHHRTDALSSIPVALAVFGAAINKNLSFLDPVGAFIISIFIFQAVWKIFKNCYSQLIDTGATEKYLKNIKTIVLETEGVKSFHALRTRKSGFCWYIDLHIQVEREISVKKGHDISKEVKKNLFAKGTDVTDVIVHLEPY